MVVVFLALTNIVGFSPLYFSAMQIIKGEVRVKLSTPSQLLHLQMSEADYNNPSVFCWAGENEFKFNGHLYDYQSIQKNKAGYTIRAIEDTKESNLADLLSAAYGQPNPNHNLPFGNLLKSFCKDFVGSFLKRVVLSLTNTVQHTILSARPSLFSGYVGLILDPPDIGC